MLSACVFVVLCLNGITKVTVAQWDYSAKSGNGPDTWGTKFPTCNDNNQSPIDIETNQTQTKDLVEFNFGNVDSGAQWNASNTALSAVVRETTGKTITVSGGDFAEDYKLDQMKFHWGESDSLGSEHTVDEARFPLELQLLFYPGRFPDATAAEEQGAGLAALSFLFEITDDDNDDFAGLITALGDIVNADTEAVIDNFSMRSVLSAAMGPYFRYTGSLTFPPCSESVIWTVFENKIGISSAQMDAFRRLKDSSGEQVLNNYRPVQNLNGRDVMYYATKDDDGDGDDDDDGVSTTTASFVLITGAYIFSTIFSY